MKKEEEVAAKDRERVVNALACDDPRQGLGDKQDGDLNLQVIKRYLHTGELQLISKQLESWCYLDHSLS